MGVWMKFLVAGLILVSGYLGLGFLGAFQQSDKPGSRPPPVVHKKEASEQDYRERLKKWSEMENNTSIGR